MFNLLKILSNWNWKKFRKNGNTRVPWRNFTEIPITTITLDHYWIFQVLLIINLGLIEAKKVRPIICYKRSEHFLCNYTSYSIYVPHRYSYLITSATTSERANNSWRLLAQWSLQWYFFIKTFFPVLQKIDLIN